MIGPAAGTRIFLACGHTDMLRGMDGLAALVQQAFGPIGADAGHATMPV